MAEGRALLLALVALSACGKPAEKSCASDDVACIAAKNLEAAGRLCTPYIEAKSQFSARWRGGDKFSRHRRTLTDNGAIEFLGDQVEFQTAAGAYVPMRYACEVSVDGQTVKAVRVQPGRLPLP